MIFRVPGLAAFLVSILLLSSAWSGSLKVYWIDVEGGQRR